MNNKRPAWMFNETGIMDLTERLESSIIRTISNSQQQSEPVEECDAMKRIQQRVEAWQQKVTGQQS